jgi:hypothetical protein
LKLSPQPYNEEKYQRAREKFNGLALNNPDLLRSLYRHDPITALKLLDPSTRFPQKLRTLFMLIWQGAATRFILKGPRGGGKSQGLGNIGFSLWFFRDLSVVDMGGSMAQAQNLYNYFSKICYTSDGIINALPDEPLMQRTVSDKGNYFKAISASAKAIRGPHPDVLMIDEAVEAKDEYITAALPMVNTSPHQLIIITSTFHKIFGIFQDIWDGAEELGYYRFSWDIFDVCRPFESTIWDDPRLNREIPDLAELHKRANGRTGDPEGWVPVANVIQAWREKSTIDWFDVEYMGNRPSAAGLVNDPEDVDACVFDLTKSEEYNYVDGAECILGIDWGFSSMTAVVDLMNHADGVKVQLENKNYTQVPSEVIIEDVVDMVRLRHHRLIYADSSGKFENVALQNALRKARLPCTVIEVIFTKEKFGTPGTDGEMSLLGNYRAYIQRRLLRIPRVHRDAVWQHKRYHYQKNSDKPAKEDDHIPDATMCALKHWPLGRFSSGIDKSMTENEQKTLTGGLINKRF